MSSSSGWSVVGRSRKKTKNNQNKQTNNATNIIDLTVDDILLPLNNPPLPFNSEINFPKQLKAVLIKISTTVTNGHCLLDAVMQGVVSHTGPLGSRKFYRDMRRDVSQWSIENPDHPVATQLTNIQFLRSHLKNPDLSLDEYSEWWNSVLSTNSYAESPLIMALAVYLDYNICVWRRATTESTTLTLDCVFSAPSSRRQIHVLFSWMRRRAPYYWHTSLS